jgi:hypothetical protein
VLSRDRRSQPSAEEIYGADDGIRTRDPNLGKVVLYQLSHVRMCPKAQVRSLATGYPLRNTSESQVWVPRAPPTRAPDAGVARSATGATIAVAAPSGAAARRPRGTTYGRLAQGESTSLTRKGS